MDLAALVDFLAPVLPYLHRPIPDAANQAVARFGAPIWEHAGRIWERLGPPVNQNPRAASAAAQLADSPEDFAARRALASQLGEMLEQDLTLRREVEELWRQAEASGVTVISVIASAERAGAVAGTDDATGTAFPTAPGDQP
jgi:hypothetical protein